MKKLILILSSLLLSVSLFGQPLVKEQSINPNALVYDIGIKDTNYNAVKSLGLNFASVVLNGVGDGLNDNGVKGWGHACNALSVGTLLIKPLVMEDMTPKMWLADIGTYVGMRFVFFDASYNLTRGLPVWYYGSTSTYDKFWGIVNPGPHILWAKGVAAVITVSIPINYMK